MIKVYGSKTNKETIEVLKYLDENQVYFKILDVNDEKYLIELRKLIYYIKIPTIILNNNIVMGFNKYELDDLINEYKSIASI